MEDILDLYEEPYDAKRPVVCFDERPCFLIAEEKEIIPAKPGSLERYDYSYKKCGSANIFGFFEPLANWRQMKVTQRRTKLDFAQCMKELVDVYYPKAKSIRVVLDNLSTHTKAALYDAFEPIEARRIAKKLDFHFTPKHGSWLNMVEIEFSVLSRQCLQRRIPDIDTLTREVDAWTKLRNQAKHTVHWQFTTPDARIKLKKLYPSTYPAK